MDLTRDLSDEAMAIKYGHVINEIPELWDALRLHEIKNRAAAIPGGFSVKSDAISVQREGSMLRLRVGHPRS